MELGPKSHIIYGLLGRNSILAVYLDSLGNLLRAGPRWSPEWWRFAIRRSRGTPLQASDLSTEVMSICVCVYVCMYVCMYVCVHIYKCAYTYIYSYVHK